MKKHLWHQLDAHPEIHYGQYIVPNFISNSVAIQSSENHWVLISPGQKMLDNWPEDRKNDETGISIIFPNHFHYMGVQAWLEQYPNAALYASKKAKPRLEKLGFEHIKVLENERPALPAGYDIVVPPGHRGGDVWITKTSEDGNNVWITCDSFLNYDRVSNQPIARAMQKVLGAAPGLKISQVIKWLLLDKRRAFKPWVLEQLEKDQPSILIPSHGEVAKDSALTEQLKGVISDRL